MKRQSTVERLAELQKLAGALGDALSPDDVARATLAHLLHIGGVVRCGLAVSRGGGRQLDFVSSDDEALTPTQLAWCHIDGLADVPLAEAVRTARSVLLPTPGDLTRAYPHLADRQQSFGAEALAALPLRTGAGAIGGLYLIFGTPQEFDDDSLEYLEAFAAQVTQALRRALAYQVEQSISERLQRSLLPQSLPVISGATFGAHYRPGGRGVDVGGDWYDVLPLPDGSVMVALGDVMGKGVPAAIVMGEIRAAVRAYALLDARPEVVLPRLDEFILTFAAPEQIVTLAYGLLRDGDVEVALAGHPPPLVVPSEGRPWPVDVPVGAPLGAGLGPWPSVRLSLPDAGSLLLYSDGVIEDRAIDIDAGVQRLCGTIAQLDRTRRHPHELCAALSAVPLPRRPDDVTLLALAADVSGHSAAETFPADSTAPPLARRWAGDRLRQWGVPEDVVTTAELCLSELVTNAVLHSGTTPRVSLRADEERVLVLVQDSGGQGAARAHPEGDAMDSSGRGLALVDALVDDWSAEHRADGTTVWFELDLAPSGADTQPLEWTPATGA